MSTHLNCPNQEIHNLIANIPGGVVIFNVNEQNLALKPRYVSESFCKMLDMSLFEVLALYGEDFMTCTHPDDYERVFNEMKAIHDKGAGKTESVYRIVKGQGEYIWVKNTNNFTIENGTPVLYAVYTEVTHEIKLQQEMEDNARLMQAIVDNIPGGVVKIVLQGNKIVPVFVSDGWCSMMGDTRDNIMRIYSKDAMAGVHPDDYDRVWDAFITAMKTGQPINSIYRVGNSKGEYRWINNRSSLVSDENGVVSYYAVYTDVTEEIEAKEQQKKTEEKLMAAMEHANVMYWEFYFANNLCINGYKSVRDLHMPEFMPNYPECVIENGFVHPDNVEEFRSLHKKLKAGIPSAELDMKVMGNTGNIEWKKVKYTTIYDESGMPVSALGTSEDITQQKNAEDRYRQAERYRQVLDAKSVGSFKLNLTKNICSDGHSYNEKILKFQEAKNVDGFFEYIFANFADKDFLEEMQQKFGRVPLLKAFEQGQSSVSCEHRYMTDTGEIIWFNTTAEMMKNPENDDVEAIIYAVDISEHKNAEMLIRGVVATEFDFITQLNANTGSYSMYIQNMENLQLPPLTGDDYYQENVEFINLYVADEDKEIALHESRIEFMVNRLENEGDYYTYYKSNNPDGTIGQKKLHIFYSDKASKIICIARTDITQDLKEQQRKNDMLKEAVALAERANQAKTTFLSRMSHDIRTPMNAIIGMADLAKHDIHDPDKVMESLSVIDSSSRHLMKIINDILDMSQIESGNFAMAKESFDCMTECKNVTVMAQVMFKEKGQHFVVEQQLMHQYFFGDIVRIKRVVINLLNNASKFTSVGGEIKLKITEAASSNPNISMITFSISDSGCGIPQDSIDDIFQPFYQVNSNVSNNGAGLGLSIVKSIVEAKGGTISVKSTVGKGSTFIVVLPMEVVAKGDVAEPKDKNTVDEKIDLSGCRILLVEDHPINTMVAKRLLEKFGAVVDTAENGAVGYDKFTKSNNGDYNLIFMDIQMPVMNGYESANAIRSSEHPQAKTIPIIATTANAYAEDIKKTLDSGMNWHIAKPISIEMIAKAINSVTKDILVKKENQNYDK